MHDIVVHITWCSLCHAVEFNACVCVCVSGGREGGMMCVYNIDGKRDTSGVWREGDKIYG